MLKKGKRELILDAAIELFAEFGYGCTSVDDISRKVNVAKGTIYNYFSSKKDILEAVITRHQSVLGRKIDELVEKHDNFSDFIFECMKMVFDYFTENTDELRVLSSVLYLNNEESREFLKMHYDILLCDSRGLEKYIEKGQISSDDIEFLHIIFSGIVTELVFAGDYRNKRYSDEEIRKIIKYIIGE